ncbi:hypothetical protein SEA_GIBBLES_105 [Gordonia phage Gibbles]|nr:hypothetical protein SEA_GIBBLES_105 [Gordonia phage Gibbles]
MRVTVTQKHIDDGTKANCKLCPIAQAITNKGYKARVYHELVDLIGKDGVNATYKLPKKATRFIIDFDEGNKVKPFTFEMRKR